DGSRSRSFPCGTAASGRLIPSPISVLKVARITVRGTPERRIDAHRARRWVIDAQAPGVRRLPAQAHRRTRRRTPPGVEEEPARLGGVAARRLELQVD